ncbi:MAG TPA: zinc ribbon domain-containing protein [Candidatus Angelobacter sp.]|nr:zinc ribbon domain-containing protein [Candidatus Angelobacter sp.]
MAKADLPIYETQLPRLVSANGVSVREDVVYTNAKGEPDDRSRKRADESLAGLGDVLPRLLEPGEAILYVIKNCQAPLGALEQFFVGWYVYRVTATRLVFTNLRLLHFGMGPGGKWNRTLKSVRWGDVSSAKVKGWISRLLELRYANGTKERYWRLPRKDGKKAQAILEAVLPASTGEVTPAQGFQSICPDCHAPLTAGNYQCGACGLKFKDEKTLRWRTILIPGGGYLYSGMTLLGVLAFLTEGLFTLGAILFVLMAVGLISPGTAENGQVMQPADLWGAALVTAVILALNKALEYLHSRRIIRSFVPLNNP